MATSTAETKSPPFQIRDRLKLSRPIFRDEEQASNVISLFGRGLTGNPVPLTDMTKKKDANTLPELIADHFNIAADRLDDYMDAITSIAPSFRSSAAPVLPDAPQREYRSRESIIDYLRSPEGFGPWADAGALTRPLLREKSPRAYTALANWLRNNELPADLPVPTKSETVSAQLRLTNPAEVREAQRLAKAAQRRSIAP